MHFVLCRKHHTLSTVFNYVNLLLTAPPANLIQFNIHFNCPTVFCHGKYSRLSSNLMNFLFIVLFIRCQMSIWKSAINVFQAREGAPSFQYYSSFRWELRQRALRLFQQAARKVNTSKHCIVTEAHTVCKSIHAYTLAKMHKWLTHAFFAPQERASTPVPFSSAMCKSSY